MEDEVYSKANLQLCSYRFLQQTAKGLGLPSNVKKVYLIQLIHTKKNGSSLEIDELVKQVRKERQQNALERKKAMRKKKRVQSTEISSTSNSKSPPVTNTPNHNGHILIRYSPEQKSPIKYPCKITTKTNNSDRVLRSSNRVKKPSYLLNNTLLDLIKGTTEERRETRVIVSKEQKCRKVNRTYVSKVNGWQTGGKVMPMVPSYRSVHTSPPPQPSRKRRLSGIYPLNTPNIKPNVAVRRADGTLSKLNAFIQKPLTQHNNNYEKSTEIKYPPVSSIAETRPTEPQTEQDFRIQNVVSEPQPSIILASTPENITLNAYKEDHAEEYSVYYHKKIRAEQVRSRRESTKFHDTDCRLPKINEVFSKFNTVYSKDLTQPIYVQVDNEPEIGLLPASTTYIPDPRMQYQGGLLLEKVYNLKNLLIPQPPRLISTMCNTRTVYSTPIITTAKAQPPSTTVHNGYDIASASWADQQYYPNEEIQRGQDKFRNYRSADEIIGLDSTPTDFRRSTSSTETLPSQDLGANVTIPEMVEDALELISQDGDYMERIGMDLRVQCILCNWAGPKIILEYHIRKEHTSDIVLSPRAEWCARYSLGGLWACGAWLSRLLQHRGELYVLSARCRDPDCFMAALTTLSSEPDIQRSGSMTIYNKVTGEPYTWQGHIAPLPPSMPYENDGDSFQLELSKMNLLPNSANLKLMNRELVVHSPTKVVVGQPELDDIYINVMVKIFD